MMIFRPNYCIRHYSQAKVEKSVKYTNTVILPKTQFPHFLNAKQSLERDKKVEAECGLLTLYSWQRDNLRGREFTLLDGPPYANGRVHLGHAINKVLKDIIIRAKLIQGHRIHFRPGWDCHGLPIELKAQGSKPNNEKESALEIRKRARAFAKATADEQRQVFQSWGILADWEREVYYTYDPKYVTQQLQIFWNLYDQGLLYRDLKPVFWSPSSGTALAESELVYKEDHVSNAVTVRLRTVDSYFETDGPVYLLIWTTTPWTLPLNEAVCYSQSIDYSLVTFETLTGQYIIANCVIPEIKEKLQKEIVDIEAINVESLNGLKYEHPWRPNVVRKLFHSDHVTATGTGLVHVAPAHGHDDFLVGLKHELSRASFVDSEGHYNNNTGSALKGLDVLTTGSERVLQKLAPDIVHQERYTHSYPYDWRTDKPVIIRASHQWFIDTEALKEQALKCLDSISGPTERLRELLTSRPYWCISRQRSWGVPIPAFYHKSSGRPLISKSSVDALCHHISEGKLDAWWTLPKEVLFPPKACRDLFVKSDEVEQGHDIMDIWFDSGIAWTGLEGRVADVCIEGGDQHSGWFQSMLLTSVAVRGCAPVKHLLTHGFAVDDDGRKMSKSLGNVVDPQEAKVKYGIDVLRWWVAGHSHHTLIPASDRHLQANREVITRLRGILRFLLGSLYVCPPPKDLPFPATVLDRYILDCCYSLYHSVMDAYDDFAWNRAETLINNFISGPVSSLYLHVIKDRLYCDPIDSPRRLSCLVALQGILEILSTTIAPILPHLSEEVFAYHPLKKDRFWYRRFPIIPPSNWENDEIREKVNNALELKRLVDKQSVATGTAPLLCDLSLTASDAEIITMFQEGKESWDSQLTELFQVACVRIVSVNAKESSAKLTETDRFRCPRCRRYTAFTATELCVRCQLVLPHSEL